MIYKKLVLEFLAFGVVFLTVKKILLFMSSGLYLKNGFTISEDDTISYEIK